MNTHATHPIPFALRPVMESDVGGLIAMIRELAAFEKLENELQVTAMGVREALFGEPPAAAAILATVPEGAAGYAIYYRTFSSFIGRPGIFLEDLYVRPAYRKQGLGRALLKQVASIADELHCGRIEWSALRWNETALRFYRSMGARELDEWVSLRMEETALKNLATGKEIATL